MITNTLTSGNVGAFELVATPGDLFTGGLLLLLAAVLVISAILDTIRR